MKRNLLLFAVGAGMVLGAGVTLAQKPDVKPIPAAKPAEKARRGGDVILKSQGGMHDDAKGIARLTGSVVVRQEGEDFVLYADSVTYDRNTNRAVATGNLRVETKDSTITGLALRADFDTKHIVISGSVMMDSHGKNTGMKKTATKKGPGDAISDVTRKPSKMTCNTIDFNYDIQEALVTGNIKLTQGETKGTCRQITFDEENNTAMLEGDVIFTDTKGQTFEVEKLIVWFDSDKLQFFGPVKMRGRNEEEKKPESGKNPPAPAKKWSAGAAPELPEPEKEPADNTSDVKPNAPEKKP
jgi:lipopolysaccharide assembly outer membrane protein LptD (OstA)